MVWIPLLVIAACLVPTLGFGFLAWDDPEHVLHNLAVQQPLHVPIRDLLLTPSLGYPIPVTILSYALNFAIAGGNAWSFHLVNALLHVGVSALVYLVARRLGLSRGASALAMTLFALHPVSAEPASWVSGRKDELAALFGLCALWLALGKHRLGHAGSLACYALALLCKPVAAGIALLCVLPPLHAEQGEPGTTRVPAARAWRRALRKLVPYLVVLVPVTLAGFRGQAHIGALEEASPVLSRAHAVWYALGHHLSLVFGWEEPTAKYLPAPWPPPFSPRVDLAPLLLLSLLALGIWKLRGSHRQAAAFGLGWAALTYLPNSGTFFPLSRFLADTYVYLPLIGLGICAGAAFDALVAGIGRPVQRVLGFLPVALSLALAPAFLLSSARFHDDEQLWQHALSRFPHHARVCRQWANGVATVRGPAAGIAATDHCIARFGDALFVKNRGVLLAEVGRYAEARQWLLRALQKTPDDLTARRYLLAIEAHAANH